MIGYRNSTVGAAFLSTLIVASLLLFFPMKAHSQTCGDTTWTLWAGQTIPVGSLTVSNDADNIYVTYAIDTANYSTAQFGTLHLWIGNDLTQLPVAGNGQNAGNPINGQFPFKSGEDPFPRSEGQTEYTFTIPFSAINVVGVKDSTLCGSLPPLNVVAHAEVHMNGYVAGAEHDTAYGGNIQGTTGSKWWFYGLYTICCNFGGGDVCFTGTAFAKGTHVWVTDSRRANPDNLPSLNLTKDRWGWAINLIAADINIEKTYDMWAGAGMNKTTGNKTAKQVGSFTVNWNGSAATVTYTMNGASNGTNGYYLEEVHIYANDFAPTSMAQLAPGSFGYPTEGYDVGNVQTFELDSIPLADTNGDGVWLIGHALVSNGNCD